MRVTGQVTRGNHVANAAPHVPAVQEGPGKHGSFSKRYFDHKLTMAFAGVDKLYAV
jgi:hypothetical protein